jgi:TRAP transporter TAXI family solute receptor
MAPLWAKNGVDVELALGQTLTKSLLKIGQGTLDSAVIPLAAYADLAAGTGPYVQMGDKAAAVAGNVRSLFGFTASTYHPIVWADGPIKSWADIKGRRVFIGPPAGAANAQITGLIKAASGLEEGRDYTCVKAPWGVAGDGFRDGQFDVYVGTYALGSQALSELSLSRKIRLLSLPNRDEPPFKLGLSVGTIPPGTYPGMVNTEPVTSWQTLMMLAVSKEMANDVAYQLTKAYFEGLPTLKAGNAAMKGLSADEAFSGLRTPLHPGAARYYREVGRSVPAALAAP